MSFKANNKQLLKDYKKIWEKVEKLIRIDFESKPVYGDDDKYIETKIKIYAGSIITNFHNKKMTKEKAPCKCLSIIMVDAKCLSILSWNNLRGMQICRRRDKNCEPYWWRLRKEWIR